MNTIAENRYIRAFENAIPREAYFHPPGPPRGKQMDLRCPNCNSSELKRVPLAYEEGRSRLAARIRLRGMVFGDDANVIVGRAVTSGMSETELAKTLRPPKKWSYGRVLLGAVLVALASLIFYVHVVMESTSKTSSMPIVLLGIIELGLFFVLLFLTWRQNYLIYPRQYERWNRSFVCQRCGAVNYLTC
jgi:hypothetical protein